MTTHIDQLTEWWENAEKVTKTNLPNKGDTLIYPRYGGDGYSIETNPDEWTPSIVGNHETVRILARAPKAKPAWHDAVAVIAHTARFSERRPFALTHTEDVLDPYNTEWITRDGLIDPAPLIEAEVTGAMIDRILDVIAARFDNYPAGIGQELAVAALGLEAE